MFVCWNFCPYWADFLPYHNRSFQDKQDVFVKHNAPTHSKVLKIYCSAKVKVIDLDVIWKGIMSEVLMWNKKHLLPSQL